LEDLPPPAFWTEMPPAAGPKYNNVEGKLCWALRLPLP